MCVQGDTIGKLNHLGSLGFSKIYSWGSKLEGLVVRAAI